MDSVNDHPDGWGFPIRKSSDQSVLATPRSLSQPATSFIASQCQGIHQMLLSRLITLIINVHPGYLASADQTDETLTVIRKTSIRHLS
jgi:hypothetical protein